MMAGNVNPQLAHDGNRFLPNLARPSASAENIKAIPRLMTKQALGHLAASGVSGAQNQYSLFRSDWHKTNSLWIGQPADIDPPQAEV